MSERKRWNNIKALAVVLTVGCLIMPIIPAGYADAGYSATTVSSNNSVTSSFFTVGLYSCTNEVQGTFVSTNYLLKSVQNMNVELKRVNTDQFQVFGSPILTPNNLFLQVSENPTGTYEYTADATGSTISYTDNSGTHNVEGVTFTTVVSELHVENNNPYYVTVSTFDSAEKYKVNIIANFTSSSIVPGTSDGEGTITCNLTFNINLSVHRTISDGIFAENGNYTATLNEHTEPQSVIEENGGGVISGSGTDTSTYYLTDASDYYNNGCQAVNISNEGNAGITSRGKADVSIIMPVNSKFIISVRSGGGANKNALLVSIYNADSTGHPVGNAIYSTDSNGISMKQNGYAYRNGDKIVKPNNSTSLPTQDSQWFTVTSQYGVVLSFQSLGGNNPSADQCVLDIVLKPST